MISINEVVGDIAEELCRKITADLPEYFGLPEINEHYAVGVASRHNFAAQIGNQYVGLISVEFPYPNNCNIYWMGVLCEFHNKSVGSELIKAAIKLAEANWVITMTVETLAPNVVDENYLKTYNFYKKNGFTPMFNLKPQNYEWDMVYMVKQLKPKLIFKELHYLEKTLANVIQSSIGCPTPQKIEEILLSYNDESSYLIGGFIEDKVIAIIGFMLRDEEVLIRHISVLKAYQKQGIGKNLISYIIQQFSPINIKAETDEESVGFYKSQGFICKQFKGQYGERYICTMGVKKSPNHLISINT